MIALEWTDTPAAKALLAKWTKGDPAAALTRAVFGASARPRRAESRLTRRG